MLLKVDQKTIFYGFHVEKSLEEASHFQFADDTPIFCDARVEEVKTLKFTLCWFDLCSGLKISFEKCQLFGIQVESQLVDDLANVFSCKVRVFPLTYLGLSLCIGLPKKSLWDHGLKILLARM